MYFYTAIIQPTMIKFKDVLKVLMIFISATIILSSCTNSKFTTKSASNDPVYTTKADIKKEARLSEIAANRAALDNGSSAEQGKQSGNTGAKYDYMPATSYSQRFNRTGNSFYLSSANANQSYNSQNLYFHNSMNYSYRYNPYMQNNYYNPWNYNSYYGVNNCRNMYSNNYPFFTYNPYLYSFNLLNGYTNPWMMQYSYYDPYYYNPYYNYNPYRNSNYYNQYNVASAPKRSPNKVYNSTSTASENRPARTTTYGENTGTTTFEKGSSGSTRGGYDTNNRAERSSGTSGSGGHKGTTRR